MTIALSQGGSVEGRAVRADGTAWSHAALRLLRRGIGTVASANADASGHFRFDRVAPGTYRVAGQSPSALPPGMAPEPSWFVLRAGETATTEVEEPGTADLDVRLETAAGAAAAGYRVSVGPLERGAGGAWTVGWPALREGVMDEGGRLLVAGLPQHLQLGLEAVSPGGERAVFEVFAPASGSHSYTLRFPAPGGARIRGAVVDARTGASLGGVPAIVSAIDRPEGEALFRRETRSQPDGTFAFDGLSAGRYRVEVISPDHGLEVVTATAPEGGEVAVAVALHPRGVLVFDVAPPAPGDPEITIEASIRGDADATRSRRSRSSPIVFENLRAGRSYDVTVIARGAEPFYGAYTASDEPSPVPIRIDLAPR